MIRFRPTVAVVDLDAVRHNVRVMMPPEAELMAVVKANGYGHGAVPVSRAAVEAGAHWLGVALVEEGVQLREAGITAPVLVLTEFPPGAEKDALAAGLTPTLYTEDGAERVARAAEDLGRTPKVHLKVDTGMHRVGLPPERLDEMLRLVMDLGMELEGLATHLAVAEAPDDPATVRQLEWFERMVADLDARGIRPRYLHAANSAGTLLMPHARFNMVRVGTAIYGVAPEPSLRGAADLRPAMSLRSRVTMAKRVAAGERISYGLRYRLARDATIATVPVGYADGYFRGLSLRGRVLIRGRRYPVAGMVTMDQLMVDCGDDRVEPGDEVVLFGRQGNAEILVEEVATWAGGIGYEIVCAVSERVPREYVGETVEAPEPGTGEG